MSIDSRTFWQAKSQIRNLLSCLCRWRIRRVCTSKDITVLKAWEGFFQSCDWVVLPFNLNCPCTVSMPTAEETFSSGWLPSLCVCVCVVLFCPAISYLLQWVFHIWQKYVDIRTSHPYATVEHLIPKPLALICCYNSLQSSGFRLSTYLQGFEH